MATKAISLRIPEQRLELIDRAAKLRGQNRTEFLVESAYAAAAAAMAERQIFRLDDQSYEDFVEALNAPAAPNERLRALMARSAPWR